MLCQPMFLMKARDVSAPAQPAINSRFDGSWSGWDEKLESVSNSHYANQSPLAIRREIRE